MVLWLFVLVPMLINRRDTVRRTSDVALATRVLNTSRAARLIRRAGPAFGHRSDPDWRPEVDDEHEDFDDWMRMPPVRSSSPQTVPGAVGRGGHLAGRGGRNPDYLDVDVVEENSGRRCPWGAGHRETVRIGPTGAG